MAGTLPGAIFLVDPATGADSSQDLFRAQDTSERVSLPAWDGDGQRLAAVVGQNVVVWNMEKDTAETWYTFGTTVEDNDVVWAPDGSGFLVRHGLQLYWFAAAGPGEPTLLLQDVAIQSIQFLQP